jgi:hypothetical protein
LPDLSSSNASRRPSFALRRHARHRASRSTAPDASPFRSTVAVSCLQLPLHRFLARRSLCPTVPVTRNGLSLARNNDLLTKAAIPGSKVPTCYFVLLPVSSTARSALLLQNPAGFAPGMAPSSLLARCGFQNPLRPLRPRPPLPFRTFTSLRIKVFNLTRHGPVRLPAQPDLPSLPATSSSDRSWLRIIVPGSLPRRWLSRCPGSSVGRRVLPFTRSFFW